MKKKILLITSTFLPEQNPRAFRWGSLSKSLAEFGYAVDVFTQKHKDIIRETEANGIRYYETDGYLFHRFINKHILMKAEGVKIPGKERNYSKTSAIIKKILASLARTFIWPDISGLWFLSSRKKIRELLANNDYDCIISSCPGFASHLIGYYAKLKSKNIKWIGEYGDPYSFSPIQSKSIFGLINKPAEAMIIKKMDYIVVPVEKSKVGFLEHFPFLDEKKIKVIPQSFKYVKPDAGNVDWGYFDSKLVNVVYTGTLYPNIRNPKMLLESLSLLKQNDKENYKKLRLHFFGRYENVESIFREYHELLEDKSVILYGGVLRENCSFAYQKADFLLNLSNISNYQTPSKLIEYLAYKKPIISLENKTSTDLDWPFLIKVDYEINVLTKFFKDLLDNKFIVSPRDYNDIIKNYDINKIREQYISLILADR